MPHHVIAIATGCCCWCSFIIMEDEDVNYAKNYYEAFVEPRVARRQRSRRSSKRRRKGKEKWWNYSIINVNGMWSAMRFVLLNWKSFMKLRGKRKRFLPNGNLSFSNIIFYIDFDRQRHLLISLLTFPSFLCMDFVSESFFYLNKLCVLIIS